MTLDFDRLKQRDNRYGFTLSYTGYAYNTQGELLKATPVTLQVLSNVLGNSDSILYKYSRHYTPGVFRLGPVDQRGIRLSCTTCSVDVPCWVKGMTETRVGHRFTNMPIAAALASPLTGTPAISFPSNMGNLLQKAYAKLSEPDVDVGLFFGELSQTVRMFTSPIKAMGALAVRFNQKVGFYKQRYKAERFKIRNGRWTPARRYKAEARASRRFADSVANAWLTYWYGVKPLMSDIEDLRQKLQKGFATPFKLRKRISEEKGYGTPTGYDSWVYRYGLWWMFHHRTVTFNRARAAVYYYPLPGFGSPAAELGLSVHQLPRLMYNLIPYSFVLNWIIDFDTWLGAISPKLYLAVCGTLKSVVSETTQTQGISRVWNYGYGPPVDCYNQHTSQVKCYLRDRDYDSAMLPIVTEPLKTFERSLSAISLLWQKMPKPNTKVFKELS